jgi:lipopolysaccharide transport system ATP-binding protein
MSKIAIRAENISKQYRLGEIGTGTISHDLNRWWHKVRGKEDPFLKIGDSNDRTQKGESDYVWSLKDINFEINQGDAVGIIGRNGAGKSTLLKLLSKVTKPTTGQFKVNGRIASLLEVGTGFHPEMTGRENIYLNGAILGMRRSEITRKFDEIVDFAGIERYIDTPVKRYSSGMYVRLAFAVAAHLESEILIVDEVLAVGDAEFQQKCLGKMGDVTKGEGRTVLFVSHNMSSIQNLCTKSIYLKHGTLNKFGDTSQIITNYFHDTSFSNNRIQLNNQNLNSKLIINDISILNSKFNIQNYFEIGDDLIVKVNLESFTVYNNVNCSIRITSESGVVLCSSLYLDSNFTINAINKSFSLYISYLDIRFYPGKYFISFWIGLDHGRIELQFLENVVSFEIIGGGKLTSRRLPNETGLLLLTPLWREEK